MHKTKDGALVLKCESNIPKENAVIFDSEKNKIGFVSEIFGPVKKPYVSVKLKKSADADKLIDKELYSKV